MLFVTFSLRYRIKAKAPGLQGPRYSSHTWQTSYWCLRKFLYQYQPLERGGRPEYSLLSLSPLLSIDIISTSNTRRRSPFESEQRSSISSSILPALEEFVYMPHVANVDLEVRCYVAQLMHSIGSPGLDNSGSTDWMTWRFFCVEEILQKHIQKKRDQSRKCNNPHK